MRSLAEFHLAAATFPHSAGSVALSPGLSERLKALQRLTTVDCGRIAGQLAQQFARPDSENDWPELTDRAQRLIPLFRAAAPAIERELKAAAQRPLPLQPGIRDIWHDHVLFVGQQVSGIIDFGALRIESPVGDVARLLGSLARNDAEQWRSGLAAYEQVRPLATDERRAVGVFDRSGVLLSGLSWLRWICLEQRRFDDRPRVLQRIDEILLRLERLGPSTSNTAGV
jgi:homoserine kinase type II